MVDPTKLSYDPTDPAILRNPHALFKRLRSEEPVHWSDPMAGWIVTRYDLSQRVLLDSQTFSADRLKNVRKHLPAEAQATAADILRWLNHWMVFRDAPDHTRLRRHLSGILDVPYFEAQRGRVREIAEMFAARLPADEPFDFVQEFAIQLPGMVIMDLFGVERDRLLEVKGWSDDMMLFIGSARGVPDKYERARRGALSMAALFQEQIEKRRSSHEGDILSHLIHSEVDGNILNDDELIGSMMMILNGGHETTANLLNNSMLALARHPDRLTALRHGNSESLVPAVDEFLRYDSPILSLGRIVTKELELGGKQISPGDRIFAMLLAANRDEDVFDDPDRLDIARKPNPHIAFGKGPHFCMGGPLARIEGQIAIGAILERFGSISLEEDLETIPWINSLVTRGPTRLPLKLS